MAWAAAVLCGRHLNHQRATATIKTMRTPTIATIVPVADFAFDPAGGTSPGLEVVDDDATVVKEDVLVTFRDVVVVVIVVVVLVDDAVFVVVEVVVAVTVVVERVAGVVVVMVADVVVVVVMDVVVAHCGVSVSMLLCLPLKPVKTSAPIPIFRPELHLMSTTESAFPAE